MDGKRKCRQFRRKPGILDFTIRRNLQIMYGMSFCRLIVQTKNHWFFLIQNNYADSLTAI